MKKLGKLPQVYDRVLKLPVDADEDVVVEDTDRFLKFTAKMNSGRGERGFRANVMRFKPCVTVVEVTGGIRRSDGAPSWQVRLPPSVDAEKSSAEFSDGLLSVIIEKRTVLADEEAKAIAFDEIDKAPEVEKFHKKKERALKQKERLLNDFRSYGTGATRSCRFRRAITYTFDESDCDIDEAIEISKKRKITKEIANKKHSKQEKLASDGGMDMKESHSEDSDSDTETGSQDGNTVNTEALDSKTESDSIELGSKSDFHHCSYRGHFYCPVQYCHFQFYCPMLPHLQYFHLVSLFPCLNHCLQSGFLSYPCHHLRLSFPAYYASYLLFLWYSSFS